MTIVPPTSPVIPAIRPFPWDNPAYTNVTPFTVRDNATMLWETERIKEWIRKTLVPHVDETYADLLEKYAENAGALITELNEALTIQAGDINEALTAQLEDVISRLTVQSTAVNEFLADQTEFVQGEVAALNATVEAAVNAIINETIEVTDPVLMGIVGNSSAEFTQYLDKRVGSDVHLEAFYLPADDGDYALTMTRALAYATPLGRAVRLSRTYPVKTRVNLPTGARVIGSGPASGFAAPVDTPLEILRAEDVTNVLVDNISLDGGITPALPAKSYTRGFRIIDSTDVHLSNMFVKNMADWAISFERSDNVSVRNHIHRGGGNGLPGGRDGLHFLDCSDVLVDGADIESGDDCVAATTETVGSHRVTFRNIRGSSDIGSVVIINEEGATTFPFSDITIESVSSKTPTRNVIRVQRINTATSIKRIRISNVTGESSPNHGVSISGATDVQLTNCALVGKQHGIYLYNVEIFTMVNCEGTSLTANYDGVSVANSKYGSINARVKSAAQWGIQLNNCQAITLAECIAIGNGVIGFPTTGGNLRVVNCTDIAVVGGMFTGEVTVSHWGLSQTGNTRLRVTDYTVIGGEIPFSNRLTGANRMSILGAAARFKEDSAGVLSTQALYNCTVVRNSIGDYTVTFTEPLSAASIIPQVTLGHPNENAEKRVSIRSASATALRITVVDGSNAPTYAEIISVAVYDQP